MIGPSIKAAFEHATRATGVLAMMDVTERANLARLRDAKRSLDEAATQTGLAIAAIERRLENAPK